MPWMAAGSRRLYTTCPREVGDSKALPGRYGILLHPSNPPPPLTGLPRPFLVAIGALQSGVERLAIALRASSACHL